MKLFPQKTAGPSKKRINKEELKKIKTTSMFVHDIRKPFTQIKSILSSFDLFKDDPIKLQAAKEDVERSIKNAETMINDILDISRTFSLKTKPVSIGRVLDFVIRQSLQYINRFNISFDYSFKAKHKPMLDENRIARALSNVMGNALEAIFLIGKLEQGKIWVTSKEISIGNLDTIEIIIGNNGPPIPAGIINQLFTLFYTSGKSSGTGLGLASASKIINLHDGKIFARNLPNEKGVEFVIQIPASKELDKFDPSFLPLHGEEVWRKEEDSSSPTDNTLLKLEKIKSSFKILLLEDEVLYRIWIRNLIEDNSTLKRLVTLYETATIEEALKIAESENLDFAIIDINLGDKKDGLDFLEILKEKNIIFPCIIHSNQILPIHKDRANQLGIKHFVVKPLTVQTLAKFLIEETRETPSSHLGKKKKCYFCDDSEIMRMHFEVIIDNYQKETGEHIIFRSFENGEDLLKMAKDDCPEVVFTDLNMEKAGGILNGYQIISEIKRMIPSCQVYLLSNADINDARTRTPELGGNGALEVPLTSDVFTKIMTDL